MASEGTTSLAPPPQGCHRDVKFTLRWPSGTVIGEFTESKVEKFRYKMCREILPKFKCEIDLAYFLLWGTTVLQEAEWSDDFDMPDGAEVTLVVLDAWFDHPNHPLYEESKAVHEARAKRRKRNEE